MPEPGDEAVRDALEAVEVARRRLRHYVYPSADDSGQANALFEQYESAIRASERAKVEALLEAAERLAGEVSYGREGVIGPRTVRVAHVDVETLAAFYAARDAVRVGRAS